IPGFDSDGAETLLQMQAAHASGRISIVGLRQATARLIGPEAAAPAPPARIDAAADGSAGAGWVVRRLRNLVVVQPGVSPPTAAGLEDTIGVATTDADAAI